MLVIGTGELGGKRLAPAPSRVRGCNSSGEGDGVQQAGVPGASCLTLEGGRPHRAGPLSGACPGRRGAGTYGLSSSLVPPQPQA